MHYLSKQLRVSGVQVMESSIVDNSGTAVTPQLRPCLLKQCVLAVINEQTATNCYRSESRCDDKHIDRESLFSQCANYDISLACQNKMPIPICLYFDKYHVHIALKLNSQYLIRQRLTRTCYTISIHTFILMSFFSTTIIIYYLTHFG